MTRVSGAWLDHAGGQAVIAALEAAGHAAYFVGGCLLARPVRDVDIATDALPDKVQSVAQAAGFKTVPTGIDHGTVTVLAHGRPHEVTTFRSDQETDGRHATVRFGTDVTEDAARRDFTMNALYAGRSGTILDPLGGLDDLRSGHLRFIGTAEARIREDYLRILRFFRFTAWYGDPALGIDGEGLAACAALADGIARLSAERVGAEMLKLLAAPDPAPSLAAMHHAGVLEHVLPGAVQQPLAPLVHLEQSLNVAPEALRRLALLGGDDPAQRFRLTRKQARQFALLREGLQSGTGTAELAYRHGPVCARDIELLRAASFGAPLPARLDADLDLGAAAQFPIRAADLMPRYAGPDLGRELAKRERRWIRSGFALSRADLLE